MMIFSERKKLAEQYEKWISENKDVLDCPLSVISWLVGEGYLGKTKTSDLEAKLAEKEKSHKFEICRMCEQEFYQDKISFAVEQFEKVKEFAEDILDDAIKNCSLNESYYDNLLDYIDKQIEELKKEMK